MNRQWLATFGLFISLFLFLASRIFFFFIVFLVFLKLVIQFLLPSFWHHFIRQSHGIVINSFAYGFQGSPDAVPDHNQVLDRADAAMNEAKSRGHNMCLVYEPSMRGAPPPAAPADVF